MFLSNSKLKSHKYYMFIFACKILMLIGNNYVYIILLVS